MVAFFFHFLAYLVFPYRQGQVPIKHYPPCPESSGFLDNELEDNDDEIEDSLPLASSKDEKDGDAGTPEEDEGVGYESSETSKEGRSKHLEDTRAPGQPPVTEGMGDSTSAAPSSSRTISMAPPPKKTPPTSTSTRPKLNAFGLPIESS